MNQIRNQFNPPIQCDFFTCPIEQLFGFTSDDNNINIESFINQFQENNQNTIALLLNPPYGLRLGKKTSMEKFYSRIAKRIHEINHYIRKIQKSHSEKKLNLQLIGYCICPNENTWSVFINTLKKSSILKCQTHHFTHGGEDRRVVSFHFKK